jgi:hypothetical protein
LAEPDRANTIWLGDSVKDQARQAASKNEVLRMAPKHGQDQPAVLRPLPDPVSVASKFHVCSLNLSQ